MPIPKVNFAVLGRIETLAAMLDPTTALNALANDMANLIALTIKGGDHIPTVVGKLSEGILREALALRVQLDAEAEAEPPEPTAEDIQRAEEIAASALAHARLGPDTPMEGNA
jgi:hypothetical protein